MLNGGVTTPRDTCDVLHDPLGCFRLSSTRLARNDYALVVFVGVHVVVGGFGHGEDMRRDFESVLVPVGLEDLVSIDTHCEELATQFYHSTGAN